MPTYEERPVQLNTAIAVRHFEHRLAAKRRWKGESQGEAGEADASAVDFVADVQADQQRGYRLNDAGVFQLAAVDSADPRDFSGEFGGGLFGFFVVAADQDVTLDRGVAGEQFGTEIVEGRGDAHFLG